MISIRQRGVVVDTIITSFFDCIDKGVDFSYATNLHTKTLRHPLQ